MKKIIAFLVMFQFVVGMAVMASATILQTWDDEASFLGANSSLNMESFESTSSSDLPLVAGDITVTTDNTTYGSFNGTSTKYGVTDGIQSVIYAADDGDSIFFDFNSAINSFGINIWGFGDVGGDPVLTWYDGLGNSETVLTAGMTGYEFFGLTSDIDIITVQFTMTGSNGDGINFDELYYGQTPSVPEPATCLLLLFGFVGMIGVKKKFS